MSVDISTDISVDMSVDISVEGFRSSIRRYVDRQITDCFELESELLTVNKCEKTLHKQCER